MTIGILYAFSNLQHSLIKLSSLKKIIMGKELNRINSLSDSDEEMLFSYAAVTIYKPFVTCQFFKSHGSTGMKFLCADANLGS